MSRKDEIEIQFLSECFDYDAETGIMRWKNRPREHFKADHLFRRWNTRYALTEAGRRRNDGYIYVAITYGLKKYYVSAHQIIFAIKIGSWSNRMIDHADGDTTNNKWDNLRECTNSHNQQNRKGAQINNKTGYIGVSYCKNINKYVAMICNNNKQYNLGYFDRPEDAHLKYLEEKRRLHTFQPTIRGVVS